MTIALVCLSGQMVTLRSAAAPPAPAAAPGEHQSERGERGPEADHHLERPVHDVGGRPVVDGDVVAEVLRRDPESDDVGAVLGDVGIGGLWLLVGAALGNFLAGLVDDEAVGEDGLVGRGALLNHRSPKRGLEPAAVLIRAFEIQIDRARIARRRARQPRLLVAHGGPAHAVVVQHQRAAPAVGADRLVILVVTDKEKLGMVLSPSSSGEYHATQLLR